MSQTCQTCMFWDHGFAATWTGDDGSDVPNAQCRALPPTAGKRDKRGYRPAIWPYTNSDDWCGSWELNR